VHGRVVCSRDTAADGEDSVCRDWVVGAGAGVFGSGNNVCRGIGSNRSVVRSRRVVGNRGACVFNCLYWADCRGERNSRSINASIVSRAVGDSGRTAGDGDKLGGVDSRGRVHWVVGSAGGVWLGGGVSDGRVSRAVGNCGTTAGDGHNLS